MDTFETACRRIILAHAATVLRAMLEEMPVPEIEQVDFHIVDDAKPVGEEFGDCVVMSAHLSNDEITGGLPLLASFDLPAPIHDRDFIDDDYQSRFRLIYDLSFSLLMSGIGQVSKVCDRVAAIDREVDE